MALFAPVLKSSQPAFINDGNDYAINFSLSDFNTWDEVLSVDIKINNQTNDSSIVVDNKKIITKEKEKFKINENSASVSIARSDITGWKSGTLYKIQTRFNGKEESTSEWSNVMIIKPITKPAIEIYQKDIISNLIPLFQATTTFNSNEKEMVDKYRFTLYNEANEIIEQSDWITHTSSIDSYRFKNSLENKNEYFIEYEIISNNGFEASVKNSFEVQIIWLSDDNLKFLGSVRTDDENACIELTAESTTGNCTGNYLITRSSEKTNYKVWEELKYFQLNDISKLTYRDYTVENGIHYKYALQRENSYGLRTNYVAFLKEKDGVAVNFEYSYLVANERQLKLKYNVELSSFKRTRLESKSDTLGSQYPTILRNGYANYREFPITGLISLHMDEDSKTFLEEKEDGLYYNNQLIVSSDDVIDYNLTAENIHAERLFRECVIDFLQNEPYKLFKSPTEGNILISLINVSLTPEETLGRMLYKFSATAYEMGNIDLDTLNKFNVLNKGQYDEIMKDGEYLIGFNQLGGYYPKGTDIYKLIKEQIINTQSLSLYSKDIIKLKSIKIESYPRLSNDEFVAYCYKNHLDKTKTPPPQTDLKIIKVRLDGNQICIISGLPYYVQHDCKSLIVDSDDSWFLIDYVYEYTKIENPAMTIKSQSMQTCFGQLSGLFTKSPVRQYIKPHEPENYSYSLSIWEEMQKQILDKYFLGSENYNWDKESQSWLSNDGTTYISFSTNKGANILQLDIEANTGTQFKINDNQTITIGNSEKYSLIPKNKKYTLDDMIVNLSFVSDCSAIVNYYVDVVTSKREEVGLN